MAFAVPLGATFHLPLDRIRNTNSAPPGVGRELRALPLRDAHLSSYGIAAPSLRGLPGCSCR